MNAKYSPVDVQRFMSILQDLIPEFIPSQKCHMNLGPIPTTTDI
jgi:hypothetical protein